MATLSFPTNPSNGDTYDFGSKTWYWTGFAWILKTSVQKLDPFQVGTLIVSTSTNATSPTSAGATFNSGVGIKQDLQVGGTFYSVGQTNVVNDTVSTSTTTGALIIAGGVGVGQNLYATQLYDSSLRVLTSVQIITNEGLSGGAIINGPGGTFTLANTGVLANYVGAGISVNTNTGYVTLTNTGVLSIVAGTDTSINTSTGNVIIWNTSTLQSITDRSAITSNAIKITNSSSSAFSNAGALTIAGGVGVGQNLNVEQNLNVWGPASFRGPVTFNGTTTYVYSTETIYTKSIIDLHIANANNTQLEWAVNDNKDIGFRFHYFDRTLKNGVGKGTSAALILQSDSQMLEWYGSGIQTTATTGMYTSATHGTFRTGKIILTDSTPATSNVTGALIVTGGAGISGSLYASNLFDNSNRVLTSVSIIAGTGLTGGGTITGPSGSVTLNSNGVLLLTAGTDTAISTSTGNILIWNTSTFQTITDRGNSTTNIISILNTSQSFDGQTGALVISGGVGVGSDVNVDGQVYINHNEVLTTASIKNLFVAGVDMLITADLSSGSVTFDNTSTLETVTGRGSTTTHAISITNNTPSITNETGALVVSGGVGIGQDLFVNGTVSSNKINTTTLKIGNSQYSYFDHTYTIDTMTEIVIDQFGFQNYETVKYLVQITGQLPASSTTLFHSSELLVTHDSNGVDTLGYLVQYGIITNFGELGTWEVKTTNGILNLTFLPSLSLNNVQFKVSKQGILFS